MAYRCSFVIYSALPMEGIGYFESFLSKQSTNACRWPIQKEHLQGKGRLSLYTRPALGSFSSSFFLCTYLIFALFAAKDVLDDETLCWACDRQEKNQC